MNHFCPLIVHPNISHACLHTDGSHSGAFVKTELRFHNHNPKNPTMYIRMQHAKTVSFLVNQCMSISKLNESYTVDI